MHPVDFEASPIDLASLLDAGIVAAIGQVVANFSLCEAVLERILWQLLFPPQTTFEHMERFGGPLTSRMRADDYVQNIERLSGRRLKDPEVVALLDKHLATFKKLKDERNALVHARWMPGIDNNQLVTQALRYTRGLEWTPTIRTEAEVRAVATEIARLAGWLIIVQDRVAVDTDTHAVPPVNS